MNAVMSRIIEFESGKLDQEEVITLFQELVDTGIVWQLQGSYGRIAAQLIDDGYITYEED